AIGALAAAAIAATTPLPATVQSWSVIIGVVITGMVGLFFGWYPARRASMLDPIEALRRE
nr:ABC transporter permease [Acidobacteriota bacterium]